MTKSKKSDRCLLPWIVTTGLTHRFIEAETRQDAKLAFLHDRPMRSALRVDEGDIVVRMATLQEVAEFRNKKASRYPANEDQLVLPLDDVRLVARPKNYTHKRGRA